MADLSEILNVIYQGQTFSGNQALYKIGMKIVDDAGIRKPQIRTNGYINIYISDDPFGIYYYSFPRIEYVTKLENYEDPKLH
jgi:hypothetical protein